MKNLAFTLIGFFLLINIGFSQAIDDRAVIPVAINLNSILRLNVTSGGNIEFNFNTLADYTNGIENSAGYNTRFTVASSVDWNVYIYAEDNAMTGTDLSGAAPSLEVAYIGYDLVGDGGINLGNFATTAGVVPLSATEEILVGLGGTSNAGDITDNQFIIQWECATLAVRTAAGGLPTMLARSAPADRYSTNVFLSLQPAP